MPLLGFPLDDSSSRISPPEDSYSRIAPLGFLFQDSSSRIPLPAFLHESFTSIASINCLGSQVGVIVTTNDWLPVDKFKFCKPPTTSQTGGTDRQADTHMQEAGAAVCCTV